MRELEWSKLARRDLLAIVDYIADDNPDAAQRLKDAIEEKTDNLREFPGPLRWIHPSRQISLEFKLHPSLKLQRGVTPVLAMVRVLAKSGSTRTV